MKLHRELTPEERENFENWQGVALKEKRRLEAAEKKRDNYVELRTKVAGEIGQLRAKATGEDMAVARDLAAREQQIILLGRSVEAAELECQVMLKNLRSTALGMRAAMAAACQGEGDKVINEIALLIAPYFSEWLRARQVIAHSQCDAVYLALNYARSGSLGSAQWDGPQTLENLDEQFREISALLEGREFGPNLTPGRR